MKYTVFILIFLGILIFEIQADCLQGNCMTGYGSAVFPKGDSYTGEWRNGKAQGKGILKYTNGDVYSGEWLDGMANGMGTMEFADGTKYYGQWKSSLAHGFGTLFDTDGTVLYKGKWIDGRMVAGKQEKNLAQKTEAN